ncbi:MULTISPECIES: AAA family ATPase [unclassified Methylophilus]|jgi:MSHA biogenesis protein MshM|uniref:ExeA family protein n=1 Tax=Methylophilus glucosoxydans TaxID=752553 RepID=A0ABW3GGB6_9PROT|nr:MULTISPECIES: AAA family ATPase [unclassified Methylophilus]MBF5039586.1 AAA family ATPase [Methylophilus sp. 13]MDF0377784.1 AAA family ATPase [Methylophilus sp. YYY-1]MDT7849043.1 AAA family ATPase [Methylophilus sp. VKM B-3414]BEV09011.1 AAA family ATPase [Methylophilus sp. DW102]
MYLQHFGLKEFPFSITPDTSFYYATRTLQEALNTLLIAIESGEGFVKITGEVGTGKTLLCRRLLKALEPGCQIAYLPNPYLDPHALLMTLATEFGVAFKPEFTHHDMIDALHRTLLTFAEKGTHVVVCLDEVQAMPLETLEALRLLSNLETEKRKLLQVVIFGQPELEERLNHSSIRQLRQRIGFEYHLKGLQWEELAFYLNHRMHVAGYQGGMVFSPASMRLLYRYANGIPRLLNILAHKALLSAFGRGQHRVTTEDVKAAILDTQASVKAQHRWLEHGFKWWLTLHATLAGFGR